jgi:hypothetical protein
VKRLCADDSAATSVKVGYRQASYKRKPHLPSADGAFLFFGRDMFDGDKLMFSLQRQA